MRGDIEAILRDDNGIVLASEHPKVRRQFYRLAQRGELEQPLPGIFTLPTMSDDFRSAVQIGYRWAGPDAVLVGRAAARFTYWPECNPDRIIFAVPSQVSTRSGQWQKTYRRLKPEHIWHRDGVPVSNAAVTAVDLAAGIDGGAAIDEALRTHAATLDAMWSALAAYPERAGNSVRRRMLRDSRDTPWSEGERQLHRLMRAALLAGWVSNALIRIGDQNVFADVLFREARLICEVDGWQFHRDREAFEYDRWRRNELELAGYRVLNFTWWQLMNDPEWVISCIRRGLDRRLRRPVSHLANQWR